MKKIITYFLALILVFQLMCPIYAGAAESAVSDTATVEISREQALLDALGIHIEMEEEYINRGEFAALAAALLNSSINTEVEESSFSDISRFYTYKNAVETVNKFGLMTGYDGKFEPVKKITIDEAIKVLVTLAGYEDLAAVRGGYPTGYNVVAQQLKLLKGVEASADGYITKEAAYKLAFNLLDTPVYEVTAITNPDTVHYTQSAEKYGEKVFGIKEISGRVVANAASALSGYRLAPAGKVTIDDTSYYYSIPGISEALGQQVNVYVREVSDGVFDIIYYEIDEYSDAIKVDKKDILSVKGFDSGDSVSYKRNPVIEYISSKDKTKTAVMGGDLQIAYNGIITTDIQNIDFTNNSGYVELMDTDGDDEYDFVAITNYVSYVIERVDVANKRLVFKYGKGNFTLGDQEVVSVVHDGRMIDFASILPDVAISVRTSKIGAGETISDSEVLYVDISSEKFSGIITNINKDKNTVVIDGKTYEYEEFLESEFIFATTFDFYVDVFGVICGADLVSSGAGEYYFMTAYNMSEALVPTLSFQFVNMSGKVVVFDAPEKVTYTGPDSDGEWVVNAKLNNEKLAEIFGVNFTGRHLFKLVVEDGVLKEIIAPINGAGTEGYAGYSEDFSVDAIIAGDDVAAHDYCLDKVYRFGEGTSLIVNNILGGADEVKVIKSGKNINLSGLESLEVYDSGLNLEAGLIVANVRNEGSSGSEDWTAWETQLFVVEKITQELREDGSDTYALHGYINGFPETYLCADGEIRDNFANSPFASFGYKTNFADLSLGDVVMLKLNNDKEITNFMSVLTFDGADIPTDYRFATGNGGDWGAILVTYYDQVAYCFDRTFSLSNDTTKIIPMTGTIYLVDLTNEEVKKLSYPEVYGLLNDASSPSPDFALVRQRRSQQIETVIYRR